MDRDGQGGDAVLHFPVLEQVAVRLDLRQVVLEPFPVDAGGLEHGCGHRGGAAGQQHPAHAAAHRGLGVALAVADAQQMRAFHRSNGHGVPPVQHGQVHGLAELLHQAGQDGPGQLTHPLALVGEPVQRFPRMVGLGLRILAREPAVHQHLQQPVGRGRSHAEGGSNLADPDARRVFGHQHHQAQGLVHGPDGIGRLVLLALLSCHTSRP